MVNTEYILKVGPTRLADVGIRERKETRITKVFGLNTLVKRWARTRSEVCLRIC